MARGDDFLGAFGVIRRDDTILMVANERRIGGELVRTWDLPGGCVEANELLVNAEEGLLKNDSDIDPADELRVRVAANYTQPDHGTVTVHKSGAFIYTPDLPDDGSSLFSEGSYSYTDTLS